MQTVTGSSPRSAHAAPWRVLATAVLAALAVVAGVADLHLHGDRAGGKGVGHLGAVSEPQETIFLGASHPAAAPHAESAGSESHFRCPVCALHLKAADEGTGDAFAGRVFPASALGGRPAAALASAVLLQPGGPRGPPSR